MRRLVALSIALALMASLSGHANAKTYRWVDADGVVHLSDEPPIRPTGDRAPGPRTTDVPLEPSHEASGETDDEGGPVAAQLQDGPTQASRGSTLAQEVMRLSGLGEQIDLLAAIAQQELAIALSRLPQREVAWYAVAPAFSRESLRRSASDLLTRELDAKRTPTLLEWLHSPLSRRIVALEGAAPTPQRLMEQAAFVNQLPSTPPLPARLALAQRLDRVGEVTDTSFAVIEGVRESVVRTVAVLAAASGTPPSRGLDPPSDRSAAEEGLKFRTVTSLLFTYQSLSDADLSRYLTFLDSSTGRWFTRVFRVALLESLRNAREEAAAVVRTR